jgi:hypothetical protein
MTKSCRHDDDLERKDAMGHRLALTVDQAARRLGLSRRAVNELIGDGRLTWTMAADKTTDRRDANRSQPVCAPDRRFSKITRRPPAITDTNPRFEQSKKSPSRGRGNNP